MARDILQTAPQRSRNVPFGSTHFSLEAGTKRKKSRRLKIYRKSCSAQFETGSALFLTRCTPLDIFIASLIYDS